MTPAEIIGEKAHDERRRAAPLIDEAVATFRREIGISPKASHTSRALSNAIAFITPSSRQGLGGFRCSNSNHEDWHILRQILTEGPAYIYINPSSLNSLESSESCSIELLAFLTQHKLVVPILQRRDAPSWADWQPRRPEYLQILRAAIAPGESTDMFLAALNSNAPDRRAHFRQKLSKFENIADPQNIFYDVKNHNVDGMLNAIAFRLSLLEAIERPSISHYDYILRFPNLLMRHAQEIHDGLMFEYRTLCGPAFTTFGGTFVMLGWMIKNMIETIEPIAGGEARDGSPKKDMALAFERSTQISMRRFDSIDWDVARDPSFAAEFMNAFDALIDADYWNDLSVVREIQYDMESDLNAESSQFHERLANFMECFSAFNEIRARAIAAFQYLPVKVNRQSSVSMVSGDAIGLSENGCISGDLKLDSTEVTAGLSRSDIISLFEDCKDSVRFVATGRRIAEF